MTRGAYHTGLMCMKMCTPTKDTIEQDADDSILSRSGTLSGGKTFSNDIDIENLNVSICLAVAYKLYSRAIKHPTNYINRLRRPTDYDTQPMSRFIHKTIVADIRARHSRPWIICTKRTVC